MIGRFGGHVRHNVVAYLALFVALGGVSYAVIPSSDGTISGCYNNSNGVVRVINADAGATCPGGTTPISWKTGTNAAGGDLTGNYPNPEIGAGKVASPEIADRQVKTPDIGLQAVTRNRLGPNAVNSAKVEDNTLTGSDVLNSSLGFADFAVYNKTIIFDKHTYSPGECQTLFNDVAADGGLPDDVALALPQADWPGTLNVSADVLDIPDRFGNPHAVVRIDVCNISQSDIGTGTHTLRLIGFR